MAVVPIVAILMAVVFVTLISVMCEKLPHNSSWKILLYIVILIATIVLVKSDGRSARINRQSGYFYDKPKITFEEGNSLSDNERIRITSSKKPIYTQSTETVIGNDLNFQGDINNYRIPIISLDSNVGKNRGSSSVRDDFVKYQKTTVKSPQISNTKFPATLNQFDLKATTQRSKLINNDFNRPSINEGPKKIAFNTGVLPNEQYIKQKEMTRVNPLPTVTSFTQSPFNVYNGGADEKKTNQETYLTVNKKTFPPLKPTVAPVKTISFNDGISSFELDKTIGKDKIFTSYKPLPSVPSKVPATQIYIKPPQSPQISNTVSTDRFEGYLNSKPKKPTEIYVQRPIQQIQTSKPVNYKPTSISQTTSTISQPKQTISQIKPYEIPKIQAFTPSSQFPSYEVPQTSIPVAPFLITNNKTYEGSGIFSPRPVKTGFTESSNKKPLSSQSLTYNTEVNVQRPSVKVTGTSAFNLQSPNYQIQVDRFSPIPKLPSYQTQNTIVSKPSTEFGGQSKFYSPKSSVTGRLPTTQSSAGYVYEIPKKSFEEIPSTNPIVKVPSIQTAKTKFPNSINIPYFQTSTFKPPTFSPTPPSFYQYSKPPKQPSNLKPQQIAKIEGPRITTFPNYKPSSGSQIPFQKPLFPTQNQFSTSTYRPNFSPQAFKPIKTQSPIGYVYNKPKETSIKTTLTESSSYKPSQNIYNYKLNQNTAPRVPYSYERQQFPAAYKPLEIPPSGRPSNKPLQFPFFNQSTEIPKTNTYYEISSRPITYETSKTPGYKPSQPILSNKPSQTKTQYKPFQIQIQDRPTQQSTFKSPEILSSLTPTYQSEKIGSHASFNKPSPSANYPQTQVSKELIKTIAGIKPSQRPPIFTKPQNSPSYGQSLIYKAPKPVSTYKPQETFSYTKTPKIVTTSNPIKLSFNQQNEIPFHKPPINKVSQPPRFPSFPVPSEPPVNILSKPVLSPKPFLSSVSSSPKPLNPYTAPLSRYPSNKPIFQGPAYIPPLEPSSKKPIAYSPSSFKPYIPVSTTEKTSNYKPYFSTSATRKPIIDVRFTYKIPVSSEKPFTSSYNIPIRPIISTEKPFLYTPSTSKTESPYSTTRKPFIYTASSLKPYVPVKINQTPNIYETSSIKPLTTTAEIKKTFTSTFPNFRPYIPDSTTEKHFSYISSTSKPFVIASTTKNNFIYTSSTIRPDLSEISRKPFTYSPPEYKPKPFVPIVDTDKTIGVAFSTRKPYIPFTTTQKPQTYAPSYVTTTRKPFTIAPSTSKPFVSITSSQKPVTYTAYTFKPFVPVSVTQKPYISVDTTRKPFIYTPSTGKQYISSNKIEKPFTYATPKYKPFVPVSVTQKPYISVDTTSKPFIYTPSTRKEYISTIKSDKPFTYATPTYKPFVPVSVTQKPYISVDTTRKPFINTPSTRKEYISTIKSDKPFTYATPTYKPFVPVSEIHELATFKPYKTISTTGKPIYKTSSSYKPFISIGETISTTAKPLSFTPSSFKPFIAVSSTRKPFTSIVETITQKPFSYTSSTYKPFIKDNDTQKPFRPAIPTYKPFVTVSKTQKPSTYVPYSLKPATSTQKPFIYTTTTGPTIVTSTTQKPFTYAISSYKPFATSRITYKPFEPNYTTQKSIIEIIKTQDKLTTQSIFKPTAFGVPSKRPSTQKEDRSYLPPKPEGYFYPKPKIPFNSK